MSLCDHKEINFIIIIYIDGMNLIRNFKELMKIVEIYKKKKKIKGKTKYCLRLQNKHIS